jgi:alkylated DNA repair dioxygenase AlkB
MQNILPFDGEVHYYPSVFNEDESRYFFDELTRTIKWKQEPVRLFGKEIMQPRLTAWYGDTDKSYTYSGVTMIPVNWMKDLLIIKERVEKLSGAAFTSVLMNLYRNGNDYMGWHRDNEKMLGPQPTIASVSFGASRVFQLRYYSNKHNKISVTLEPGSVLLMRGKTQNFWEHRLPKAPRLLEPRINLTLRNIG